MLLTDGLPNINPPRGILPMLKRFRQQGGACDSFSISTFGFGYNLDSSMLREIAEEGDGMYAFIPDSSFVGTAFVNATSNLLCTMARNVTLTVEAQNDSKFSTDTPAVLGQMPHEISPDASTYTIRLGNLQYGQSRHIVVRLLGGSPDHSKLNCTLRFNNRHTAVIGVVKAEDNGVESESVIKQRLRLEMCDLIREITGLCLTESPMNENLKVASLQLKNFVEHVRSVCAMPSFRTDAGLKDMLEDLTGQVTEATSRPGWFKKWGMHYLPSLGRAHLVQQCNNFKDPGVQHYGGELFQNLRDTADDIFCKLPPPVPSRGNQFSGSVGPGGRAAASNATTASHIDMSSYNNRGNPCFHGDSMVQLANGYFKPVRRIMKGDVVVNARGETSNVRCVVRTLCKGGSHPLVKLEGLLITDYHPVRFGGEWHFPVSLARSEVVPCDAIYSFVLDARHTMMIGGVECVCLGHDFKEAVVRHEFFGSPRVIEALRRFNGWGEGLIEFQDGKDGKDGCMLRDPSTGLISSFDPSMLCEVGCS